MYNVKDIMPLCLIRCQGLICNRKMWCSNLCRSLDKLDEGLFVYFIVWLKGMQQLRGENEVIPVFNCCMHVSLGAIKGLKCY